MNMLPSHRGYREVPTRTRRRVPVIEFLRQTSLRTRLLGGFFLCCLILLYVSASTSLKGTTLLFSVEELREIYEWEIKSGNYPTRKRIPAEIGIPHGLSNPAAPPELTLPSSSKPPFLPDGIDTALARSGPLRTYHALEAPKHNIAYPPRPVLNSSIDFDKILQYCDFSTQQYVKDCLQMLRVAGGLDSGPRIRLGNLDQWKYIFTQASAPPSPRDARTSWEPPGLPAAPRLLDLAARPPMAPAASGCDPARPRLFHMYWSGPFTDKPYLALLSFLYTQNFAPGACAPRFWVWLADADVGALAANAWAAPFLHARLAGLVAFKAWDTAARLDALPETAGWRTHRLLGAGTGRGAVEMSDLARFVLTQTFGGLYVDADVVFLRDWAELWGWPGAFAMRWSWHAWYNTAVLRMHKGSALGSFLLTTAMRSKSRVPFHPETVSRYMREAGLEPLLYRVPDALFDPNFLNMEGRQQARKPFPAYPTFEEFFELPPTSRGEAGHAPFEAFYRGAYAYHWHNSWRKPVDRGRNFPDLGERFARGVEHKLGSVLDDERDLTWSAVLKRTFEAYLRGERPNMYGEWFTWD